ncbi:MAG: hypothetical protein C6W55_16120 [Thermobacillus sp.]|nr:MAG: hypothetical protein C6W55_16120 [Thermobacillus sp.]
MGKSNHRERGNIWENKLLRRDLVPMESLSRVADEKKLRVYSVLVIDKFPAIVEGTKRLLEQEKEGRFRVCGVTELYQAVREMKEHFYHCVLLDLFYPNIVNAINKLCSCNPNSKILIFTNEDPSPYFNRMIKAGAVGFLSKTSSSEQMANGIIAAIEGQSCVPIHLIRELRRTVTYIEHQDGVKCEEISEREEEVLKYIALGYTYKEMANQMYISQRSIENLVSNLYKKFNVTTRKDMINKAREVKLLPKNIME